MNQSQGTPKVHDDQRSHPSNVAHFDSLYMPSAESTGDRLGIQAHYQELTGKNPNRTITIRSGLAPDSGIQIDRSCPFERVIADLIDAPEIQRLREVQQLSASWVAFPEATHTRFEHVVGSAKLTADALKKIRGNVSPALYPEIDTWGPLCVAFAMLHDIGHIAPGSHLAQKVWFPKSADLHEEVSHALLESCPGLRFRLIHTLGDAGFRKLLAMVKEGKDEEIGVPPWTYQLIVGGGWNTDRGDWVKRDSKKTGVLYGDYDPTILLKNLTLSNDHELAVKPAAIHALEHFFMARAQMYINVYYDETSRIGEKLHELIGCRARELFEQGKLEFADETVNNILSAENALEVAPQHLLEMTDSTWWYHVNKWARETDPILSELCRQLRVRDLPKPIRDPELAAHARQKLSERGLNPDYWIIDFESKGPNLRKDLSDAIKVIDESGNGKDLQSESKLFAAFNVIDDMATASAFTAVHPSLLADINIQ